MFKKLLSVVKKEKISSVGTLPEKDLVEPEKLGKAQMHPDLFEISFPDLKFSLPEVGIESKKCEGINTVYYFSEILTELEEEKLLNSIDAVNDKEWIKLQFANRRLLKLGGDVTNEGLKQQESLPICFEQISTEIFKNQLCPKKPNHVLLNNYPRGIGIMSHFDGPLYYPWVNSISIGSTCLIKFTKQPQGEILLFLLERRSMLIFTEEAYGKYQHGIDDCITDTILLAIDDKDNQRPIEVKKSSIINLKQTRLYQQISKLTLEQALELKLIIPSPDQQEIEFNYLIELPRENRVSLTIRNVPIH